MAKNRTPEPRIQERRYDFSLLFITVFLCVFGLIMVYSASYYTAELKGFGGAYYFNKQLRNDLIGLGILILAAVIPYNRFYPFGVIPAYIVGIVCMVLTRSRLR